MMVYITSIGINLIPVENTSCTVFLFHTCFVVVVCRQLILLSELYSPHDISENLMPVAIQLTADKVAEVRLSAFRLVSVVLYC